MQRRWRSGMSTLGVAIVSELRFPARTRPSVRTSKRAAAVGQERRFWTKEAQGTCVLSGSLRWKLKRPQIKMG